MSYNSTGLNNLKIDWIQGILETCDIDYLQVQEHFKATKTVDKFFKQKFSNTDSYVIPAHREPFQESGRAKGGLAQLASKKINIKKERIKTKSWRLQAQILHIGDQKLMWINCYCPTDPQTVHYDNVELQTILLEVESILDSNLYDDCILGGDLNYDRRRASGFVAVLDDFFEKIGLFSVWDKFPVDFTHIHTDNKSTSIVDHFFMNQRLLDLVQDAGPVHLGDNRSRHSPIMMKIRFEDIPTKIKEPKPTRSRTPAWYKATEDDKNQYTVLLDQKLSDLIPPASLC